MAKLGGLWNGHAFSEEDIDWHLTADAKLSAACREKVAGCGRLVVRQSRRPSASTMGTIIPLEFLRGIIRDGSPSAEGARLAKALLSRDDVDWSDLTVDFRSMPSELLNISFFYGFLQQISETRSEVLDLAREVRWTLSHGGLEESIAAYMTTFRPRSSKSAA